MTVAPPLCTVFGIVMKFHDYIYWVHKCSKMSVQDNKTPKIGPE